MPRLLPNWISAYLAYTADQESPTEFHTWIALSTIAGVVRRRVYFDMGYFHLYPNLYVVLVSPAGLCKKSTAMRISRPMIASVPGVNFSVDSTSRERLIQDLSQAFSDGQSAMTAYSTEFASFLTTSGMDMVVFLTDIYDCPPEWSHRTKMGGTNTIKVPCLNVQAATTPDWLAKAMPLDTIGIGLTARVIFVYSDTPRILPPFPSLSPEQKELTKLMVEDLIAISNISGQYTLDAAAKELYEQWYLARREEFRVTDSRLTGYFERKPMHLLKIAMILNAATTDDLVITQPVLISAMDTLTQVERTMPRAFIGVGKNPLAVDIEHVLAVILVNPEGIAFGDLLGIFKHAVRKNELEEVLDTLAAIGHITKNQTEKGVKYYPVHI